MSVYSQISQNKWKTYLIMAIFVFLFSGFFYLVGIYFNSPNAYLFLGLAISIFSTFGSYYWSDKIVLWTAGAVPADKKTYFDFYTSVENLSIASGLPMPKLYVIDDAAPNAFATGRDPKHAVVCATTGLLRILDRSDIEGVISHELSHIKNYDILLSSIVAVLVGTIALLSDWIMRSMFWRGRDRDSNRSPIFFFLFIIALILTPIVATLIQLAISRKREFLADASGVLVTRNPAGLASALEKISAFPYPMKKPSSSIAHLFISNPLKKSKSASWVTSLFSTHPPVEERIKVLRSL
jgi:heat shock protein HtpX